MPSPPTFALDPSHVYPMFTLIGLKITKPLENQEVSFCFSDPAGIRTQDPYIKSVLLYRLSYRIMLLKSGRKYTRAFFIRNLC